MTTPSDAGNDSGDLEQEAQRAFYAERDRILGPSDSCSCDGGGGILHQRGPGCTSGGTGVKSPNGRFPQCGGCRCHGDDWTSRCNVCCPRPCGHDSESGDEGPAAEIARLTAEVAKWQRTASNSQVVIRRLGRALVEERAATSKGYGPWITDVED